MKKLIRRKREISISHEKFREQKKNLEECYAKLRLILADCSREHKKKEVGLKKETEEMKEKRIRSKKLRSERQSKKKMF